MASPNTSAWRHFHRWSKICANGLALMLLTSAPGFGLVFTGNWVIRQTQTGKAPKAIVDTTNPSTLLVDMGVNSRRNSSSTVVARRKFVVHVSFEDPRSSERALLIQSFTSLVQDGSIEVVTRIIGCNQFSTRYFQNVDSRSVRTLGQDRSNNRLLRPGFYTLEITIKYSNRQGFWDNHSSGSPHRFTFSSI